MLVDILCILGIAALGLILFPYILMLAILLVTTILGIYCYIEYWVVHWAHKLARKTRRK